MAMVYNGADKIRIAQGIGLVFLMYRDCRGVFFTTTLK